MLSYLILTFLILFTTPETGLADPLTNASATEIKSTEVVEEFPASKTTDSEAYAPQELTENFDDITVSSFVPAAISPDQSPEESQKLGKTGTEVTTLFVDGIDDFAKIIQKAQEMVAEARASNPNLPNVQLMILTTSTDSDGLPNAQRLGELIERGIDGEEIKFEVRPTKELLKAVKIPKKGEDAFENVAYSRISKARTSFSILRGFVAGTATGVGLITADVPVPMAAVLAGSVLTGLMSGNLQYINDYYKNWVVGKAFWDKADHHEDKAFIWKTSYFGWKILKESVMLTGYLAALNWTTAMFGGTSNYFTNPYAWIGATTGVAGFAAITETPWIMYDGERREAKLKQNWIINYHDQAAGEAGARKILLQSQKAAVILSAVATFAQILAIGSVSNESASIMQPILHATGFENARQAANAIMIGLGITGGVMYVWKCTNVFDYGVKVWQKLKSSVHSACSGLFGQSF